MTTDNMDMEKEVLVNAVRISRITDVKLAMDELNKFMKLDRPLMTMSERKQLISQWAKNDADWVVNRSEGKERWRQIRRRCIEGWKISEMQQLRLKRQYDKELEEKLLELKKLPKKYAWLA